MSTFCAICCDAIDGIPTKRPLGRNDALVSVCDDCDSTPPREISRRLDYVVPVDVRVSTASIREAANRVVGDHHIDASKVTPMAARTAGWLLVRVIKRDARGRTRDMRDALVTLSDKPWAREVRYLGSDRVYFLFERPDPKVASDERLQSNNPIVWLEQFRVVS